MKFVIFIILFFASAFAFSQQTYSLQDCFAVARENNISLKKSKNDIDASNIDKKAATFNLLPSIYANAEHIFSSGKNIDPVTNNFVRDNFSGGEFDVTFQLNVFSGFTALNTIKSSLYKVKSSEYNYQNNTLETFSAITMAYAKIMFSKEQTATIRSDNLLTQNELNIVQEKIDVGKLSKSDYYTLNTRYISEQASLIAAQNDSALVMNDLKYLIGFNSKTLFNIKDVDSTEIQTIAAKNFKLTEILDTVLKNHPALLASMYTEKSVEMDIKTARGNLLPGISFVGNIFSNYNLSERNLNNAHIAFGKQLNNNFGKTAGVLVTIPLFDKYQNNFAIEKEKITLSNTKLYTQQIENDIEKKIHSNYLMIL